MANPIRIGNPLKQQPLISHIVQGLTKTYPTRRREHLFAGDAAMCHRKAVFSLLVGEDDMTRVEASGVIYMRLGSAFHDIIADAFRGAGLLLASEVRLEPDFLNLAGYVDDVIELDGKPLIIEVKTCGALPSTPKPWHYEQAMTYSLVTGIRDPIVLYVSRNVASYDGRLLMAPLQITADDDKYEMIARRLVQADEYAKLGKIGEIPIHIRDEGDCGFCPFKAICWDSEPSFVELATAEERRAVNVIASEKAKKLVEEMPERRSEFLASL